MELSQLDLRILRFALEEGLLESEREIARRLRISPSTFSFKMRKFEDKGVITAYRYRVDFAKLGIKEVAWIRLRPEYGKRGMEDYMRELLEFPQVHVCVFTSGSKNFAVKAYSKDWAEMQKTVLAIRHRLGVKEKDTEIFRVTRQIKGHNKKMDGKTMDLELDESSYKILSEKMQNPKESTVAIARKLGLHRNTVSAKWSELLREKIIVKKTPIINPGLHRQIGIHCMAMHILTPKNGKKRELVEMLSAMNEVHELNEIEGGKILAIIRTDSLGTYFTLTSRFLSDRKASGCIEKSLFNVIIASDSRRPTYLKDLGF